jgi:hypothetical protein
MLRDIRDGLTEADLMQKYSLSSAAIQMIYRKLVDQRLVNPEKLYGRIHMNEDWVGLARQRRLPRVCPESFLVIYDSDDHENRGRVLDMTESGVGALGMRASINESKTLIIPPNDLFTTKEFVFRARCCWTRVQEETQEPAAGFEITKVTDGYFLDFVKLVGGLSFVR